MRKTTAVVVGLLAAALTVFTAPAASADPTPTVSAPAEGATVATGFTGPVSVYFTGISEGRVHTLVLVCDDGTGPTQVDSRSVDPDGTSAPQSYSVAPITGPSDCVLTVRDPEGTAVVTRSFTVAGPALVLSSATLSAQSFYPTVVDGFRDSVTASWTSNKTAGHVAKVLNSNGAVVRRAELGDLAAGAHQWVWNGRSTSGSRVPVGTYRIRLEADDHAGSTRMFVRSVLVRSSYVVRRHSMARAGSSSATSTSGPCFVTRSTRQGTTNLDCWGGRYARASYTFRLPADAYAVRYSLSGQRTAADICCSGRIMQSGSRVSRTAFRVTATVTGWRAYDVRRAAVSYAYRHKI